MKKVKEVLFDLDGTLAYDIPSGKFNPGKIGGPIPRMVERAKEHFAAGDIVKIFTARACTLDHHTIFEGTAEEYLDHVTKAIKAWCLEHVGQELEVTCVKDYKTDIFYDDRAIQIIRNTGLRADGVY